MTNKNQNKKIIFGISLIVASLFLISLISAADTTPPIVSIYLSQEAVEGAHNPQSYKLTINAHLYNAESISYDVTACQIDWGTGLEWESVSKGTESNWYMVSHTYTSSGLKTINYRCQNDAGLWSSGSVKHVNWDDINILLQAPVTEIYLSQNNAGQDHNDFSYNRTITAHLVNNHTLYDIDECIINWGDGTTEDPGVGTAGNFYTLDHTYSSIGVKTVTYVCTVADVDSSGSVKHINWDSIEIFDTTPPLFLLYSPVESGNYFVDVPVNATGSQLGNWVYSLNGQANVSLGSGLNVYSVISSGLVNGTNTLVVSLTNSNGTFSLTRTFDFSSSVPPLPDTTAPIITLLGFTPVDINVGEVYADAGATASDDVDGDITSNIITVNPVDTNTAGTYTVTYNVQDSAGNDAIQVTRTVNVNVVPPIPGNDTTAPNITNGPNVVVTNQSAVITITLSELANATVNYGLSETNLTNTVLNPSYLNNTTLNLIGLISNTTYFYNLTLCDVSNNCAIYGPFNFATSVTTIEEDEEDDDDDDGEIKLVLTEKSSSTSSGSTGVINLGSEKSSSKISINKIVMILIWLILLILIVILITIIVRNLSDN